MSSFKGCTVAVPHSAYFLVILGVSALIASIFGGDLPDNGAATRSEQTGGNSPPALASAAKVESTSSNSTEERSREYLHDLTTKIEVKWCPPKGHRSMSVTAGLADNGRLLHCEIAQPSGWVRSDGAGLIAVKEAAPFGAVPKTMLNGRTILPLIVHFGGGVSVEAR